jgi:hypothetical protein
MAQAMEKVSSAMPLTHVTHRIREFLPLRLEGFGHRIGLCLGQRAVCHEAIEDLCHDGPAFWTLDGRCGLVLRYLGVGGGVRHRHGHERPRNEHGGRREACNDSLHDDPSVDITVNGAPRI